MSFRLKNEPSHSNLSPTFLNRAPTIIEWSKMACIQFTKKLECRKTTFLYVYGIS